mgnify:CR=1 FL=1
MQQMLTRIEALAVRPELTLKAGERALRDVRTTLGALPPLPSKRDYEDVVKRLKAVQSALMPKVQELRDVADWQRWANVGIQEQLCERWKRSRRSRIPRTSPVTCAICSSSGARPPTCRARRADALWRRFKTAHDEVWARCEAHFAEQAGVRAENLAKKVALCERAEALSGSTNWIQTADEIKKLQAEWKTIGPVTRGQEKTIWERFRSRVRSLLHPPPRRSRPAQDVVGGEPRQEGRALRQGRGAGRLHRLGRRGQRDQTAAERVEDDRAGEEDAVGSHLAAVSAARAIASSAATLSGTTSPRRARVARARGDRRRARGARGG